jgi:hypothetical protein
MLEKIGELLWLAFQPFMQNGELCWGRIKPPTIFPNGLFEQGLSDNKCQFQKSKFITRFSYLWYTL